MSWSETINSSNLKHIREQIDYKNQSINPFYATSENASQVVTDQDHFPYTRFFRGVYDNPNPVVFTREAGYRPRHENCYDIVSPPTKDPKPNHCFESACSTVYPCYPEQLSRYSDKNKRDLILNKACIIQYR